MFGNDRYGDCGVAGELHAEMTTASAAGTQGPAPTDTPLAIDRYVRFTGDPTPPGPGVNLAEYLLWLYKQGVVLAFAPVTHHDVATQDAFMAAGFGLYVGVCLTANAQQDFANHSVWGSAGHPQPTPDLGHCFAPGTRVLTADLRWVPIETLEEGDVLVGFDEDCSDDGATDSLGRKRSGFRQYRRSFVEAMEVVTLPSMEVELDDGTILTCSNDHRWITPEWRVTGAAVWRRTDELRPGIDNVAKPLEPWETDTSWGAGYLAGAFDGEGWLSTAEAGHPSARQHNLGMSQRDNEMLEAVRMAAKARGFNFTDDLHHRPQPKNFSRSTDIHSLRITGKRPEMLRFLGAVRPQRLLANFSPDRLGSVHHSPWVGVRRVTPVGEREVIALQTSSRTYIAEGFLAHNCILRVGASGPDPEDESAYVTWGDLQMATREWDAACVEECWLVVTHEEQLAKFTPQLLNDCRALIERAAAPENTTPQEPQDEPEPQDAPSEATEQEVVEEVQDGTVGAVSTWEQAYGQVASAAKVNATGQPSGVPWGPTCGAATVVTTVPPGVPVTTETHL